MTFLSETQTETYLAAAEKYNREWEEHREKRRQEAECLFYKRTGVLCCLLSASLVIGGLCYVFS